LFRRVWAARRVVLMGDTLAIVVSVPLVIASASSRILSRTLNPFPSRSSRR
jgi:NitT/TauT family transport system permease protein